jgi:hypothetical protein
MFSQYYCMYSILIVLAKCVWITSGYIIPSNPPDFINHLLAELQPLTTLGPADTLPTIPEIDNILDQRLTLRKVRPVTPLNVNFNYTIEPLPPTVTLLAIEIPDTSAELEQTREAYMIPRLARWAQEETRYLKLQEFTKAQTNETLDILPAIDSPLVQK